MTEGFWASVGSFMQMWQVPLGVLAVLIGAVVVRWILIVVIRRTVERIVTGVKRRQRVDDTRALVASPVAAVRTVQRTRTLGTVLTNIVNVTIVVIALLMVVSVIDPGIIGSLAIRTAALGAGLGFGAQNIVKDVLNGLFMVVEDQLGVGDVVDVGPATGVVEAVGIRVTQVRDVNGTLWYVRNGEILRVGNLSQGWSRVITDIAVPYDADIEAVQSAALGAATALTSSAKWRSRIIDSPELWGIESISENAIVLRLVVKTRTNAKDDVARELRARVKAATDALDVTLPSLQSVVLSGFDGATSVQGANPPRTRPTPTPPAEEPSRPRWTPWRTR